MGMDNKFEMAPPSYKYAHSLTDRPYGHMVESFKDIASKNIDKWPLPDDTMAHIYGFHLALTPLFVTVAGINLGIVSADETRRYIVTSPLIGWAHTQYNPCGGDWYINLLNPKFVRICREICQNGIYKMTKVYILLLVRLNWIRCIIYSEIKLTLIGHNL